MQITLQYAYSAVETFSPEFRCRACRLRCKMPGTVLPPGVAVQNYLVFAILATVLCCIPAGIPAIIYAAQVNGKLAVGDLAGAKAASENAKMWCWVSFGLGFACYAIGGLFMMLGMISGLHR